MKNCAIYAFIISIVLLFFVFVLFLIFKIDILYTSMEKGMGLAGGGDFESWTCLV